MSLPLLPTRSAAAHKGDFGWAVLIGGSRGMSGAIGLAGMAALRTGAGKVTLAVPDCCVETVAAWEPSYMVQSLPAAGKTGQLSMEALEPILELALQATCLAIGPGLGQSPTITKLISRLYKYIERPLVIDADALNALAHRSSRLSRAGGPRILTPHLGEFRRLTGDDKMTMEQARATSINLAKDHQVVILLKGANTQTTNGTQTTSNDTGNPGMATGGSGDVLTGVITALVCQGLEPYDAARLGAHLHGAAGDRAARKIGQVGMIARDIVNSLPQAVKAYGQPRSGGKR